VYWIGWESKQGSDVLPTELPTHLAKPECW